MAFWKIRWVKQVYNNLKECLCYLIYSKRFKINFIKSTEKSLRLYNSNKNITEFLYITLKYGRSYFGTD